MAKQKRSRSDASGISPLVLLVAFGGGAAVFAVTATATYFGVRASRPAAPVAARSPAGDAAAFPVPTQKSEAEWRKSVQELAASGHKLEAIQVYRENTGAGLKEAKDFVEALEASSSGTPVAANSSPPAGAPTSPPSTVAVEKPGPSGSSEIHDGDLPSFAKRAAIGPGSLAGTDVVVMIDDSSKSNLIRLKLQVYGAQAGRAVAIGRLKIEAAADDQGRPLKHLPEEDRLEDPVASLVPTDRSDPDADEPLPAFFLELHRNGKMKAIARLQGTLQLLIPRTERPFSVRNVPALAGKPITEPDLRDVISSLKTEAFGESTFFNFVVPAKYMLADAKFSGEDGPGLKGKLRESGDHEYVGIYLSKKPPATFDLNATLCSDFEEHAVSFTLENLSLPVRKGDDPSEPVELDLLADISQKYDGFADVDLSPDGGTLVTLSSYEKSFQVWSAADGKLLAEVPADQPAQGAFSADGTTYVTAESGGSVSVWDARTFKRRKKFPVAEGSFKALAVSADGKAVYAAPENHAPGVWDLAKGQRTNKDAPLKGDFYSLAVTGKAELITGESGVVRFWDPKSAKSTKTLKINDSESPIEGLALSPDGRSLAVGSWGIQLYDLQSGQLTPLAKDELSGSYESLAFSPDGKTLLATDSSSLVLWDVPGAKIRARSDLDGTNRASFSADGTIVARVFSSKKVHVYRILNLAPSGGAPSVATSAPAPAPPKARQRGGLWTFDERDGPRLVDSSGSGNDGRLEGENPKSRTQRIPGKSGSALRIAGSAPVIDGAGDFEGTDPFSAGLWVKRDGNQGKVALLSKIDPVVPTPGWELCDIDGKLEITLCNGWRGADENSALLAVQVDSLVKSGEWHHVAFTYDGSQKPSGLGVYLDGRPVTFTVTRNSLKGSIRTSTPLRLGARVDQLRFTGALDEVAIFDRRLTPEEIPSLMTGRLTPKSEAPPLRRVATTTTPAPVVPTPLPRTSAASGSGKGGHWSFDEVDGPQLTDSSGSGNHGRMGMPSPAPGRVGKGLGIEYGSVKLGKSFAFESKKPFSIAVWTWSDSPDSSQILGNLGPAPGLRGFALQHLHEQFLVRMIGTWENDALGANLNQKARLHRWIHLGVTYDGSGRGAGVKMSIDGAPADSVMSHDTLTQPITSPGLLLLGALNQDCYVGRLDELRIYRRVLAPAELAELAGQTAPGGLGPGLARELAVHWSFDADPPGKIASGTAPDAGGELHVPKPLNQRVPGKAGKALRIEGAAAVLDGAGDFDVGDPFSVGVWVRREANQNKVALLSKLDPVPPHTGWEVCDVDGRILVTLCNAWRGAAENSALLEVFVEAPIPLGEWHHVAFTYDGSEKPAGLQVYVDGQAAAAAVTQNSLNGSIRSTTPLRLGARTSQIRFTGALDELAIFNRRLAPEEIPSLMTGRLSEKAQP